MSPIHDHDQSETPGPDQDRRQHQDRDRERGQDLRQGQESDVDRGAGLQQVATEVGRCTDCRLHLSASRAVPGEGPVGAKVMFIGEAPGHHEDRQGRPFVGAAGRLLEELLGRIGLRREEVFITNVVKHRPPGNRDPQPDEIEACRSFLERQIELVDPTVIATLGRFAMERFMPGAKISQAHGKPRRIGGRIFVPVLHPAAALHRGDWRPKLEEDFQTLRRVLDEASGLELSDDSSAGDAAAEQLSLF